MILISMMNFDRFRGLASFPANRCQQAGGDRDIPVPHGITEYVPCALAGNNAQCSFTVVIKQESTLGPLRARRPTVVG